MLSGMLERSGRVGPTAILEPVELAGVTVRRATLNNIDDIRRKGVRIGAEVFARRSNDVIPEIMGVSRRFFRKYNRNKCSRKLSILWIKDCSKWSSLFLRKYIIL